MLFIALPPVCLNERARLGHVRVDLTRVGKQARTRTDEKRPSGWTWACFHIRVHTPHCGLARWQQVCVC